MSFSWLMRDGDIAFGEDGAPIEISGLELLDQEVGEELDVPYDSINDTGNKIISRLRGQVSSQLITTDVVTAEITAVIERLGRLQQEDPYLTEEEAISHIERLIVIVDEETRTDILYYLDVRSQATSRPLEREGSFPMNNIATSPGTSLRTRIGAP